VNRRNNNFESVSVFGINFRACRGNFLFIAALFLCGSATAEEKPNLAKPKIVVPDQIAGVTTVSAEQVIEILTSKSPPMLIDARIKEDRDYGYIESSISLPDIEISWFKGGFAEWKEKGYQYIKNE